ncbi:hypothetical protein E4U40_004746 [Claviceps sp. LM458 group G5]|nr:hypothetical protein E4U40_004746 [Claviceps sp. LM458 group G5]
MKSLCRTVALRAVRFPIRPSIRALSTTTPLNRSARKKKPRSAGTDREGTGRDARPFEDLAAIARKESLGYSHARTGRVNRPFNDRYSGKYEVLRSMVLHRLQLTVEDLATSQGNDVAIDELRSQASLFEDAIYHAFALAEKNVTHRGSNPLFWSLRHAFVERDLKGLRTEMKYLFQSFLVREQFSKDIQESLKRLVDFRFPHEWFPATRTMQRTIHVHVGPTNSGKTYNALKALENSKSGVYAGPLRLLATEVYQRLEAKGRPCALITGEEVRIPEGHDQYFSSCTVEMIPLNAKFDVAVIDEIQMIADPERGTAWTSALLGVQAKEVHVCGEDRTVALLQALCASIGDKCVVHRYERLSPLRTMSKAIQGDYSRLQKGDAVVGFSRKSLHALKRTIETKTGRRCAIIYGSLPPEVRVQQASLFNDPDNDYDFVVASDAIGMGLNLEIRRVIFESVTKYDGNQHRILSFPEIKQIGGRAGRYRSARDASLSSSSAREVEEEKVGLVTTMDEADLRSVQRAFQRTVDDIEYACIQPPAGIIERFASYFPPDTPLSFIMLRMNASATVGRLYHLGVSSDILEIADIIQDIPLTIYDRLTFCYLPASLRAQGAVEVLRALARVVANNSSGSFLDIKEIPLEFLDVELSTFEQGSNEYLAKLEALHVAINQYVWLSYRYAGMFRDQALAFHVRHLVEEKLIATLDRLDYTEEQLQSKRQKKRLEAHRAKSAKVVDDIESRQQEPTMVV